MRNNPKTVKAYHKEYKQRNRAFVKSLKETTPCIDCRCFYPSYVMDFDHLRDKKHNISEFVGRATSLSKIKEEIAKCELVCSNCHRIRTYSKLGFKTTLPL